MIGVQSQFFEALVFPDEVSRRIFDQRENPLERRPVRRRLEILDCVELDAALAQPMQRGARVSSAGVVINHGSVHAFLA
jgi:hypothetical protein